MSKRSTPAVLLHSRVFNGAVCTNPDHPRKPTHDGSSHFDTLTFENNRPPSSAPPLLLRHRKRRSLHAQLVIKLTPQTVADFQHYADTVEASLNARWQGKQSFLSIDDDESAKKLVLGGDLFIKQMGNAAQPVQITDGLIHDWLGAIYIPNTKMDRVLKVLQDFDNHKTIYPEVADSKLIRRTGNDVTGYWRLQQKGFVPVILDVEQNVHFEQLSPGKWKCQAYARNITEIDTGLFTRGRRFPLGEGHGYLWRLYAYWSLEEFRGGVLAECRTLSLSRDIPPGARLGRRPLRPEDAPKLHHLHSDPHPRRRHRIANATCKNSELK